MGRRPGACLLLVGMLLAGCGDDDDAGGGDTPRDDPAASGLVDERSVEEKVADFDLADDALLQLADLPTGWVVDPSEDNDAADDRLFACYGLPPETEAVVRNEESEAERGFLAEDQDRLTSTVTVYPNDEYAAAAFAPIEDAAFVECYRTTLQEEIAGGTPGITVEVSATAIDVAALGDEAAGQRFDITLSGVGGEQRSVVVDLIGVRAGRAVTSLTLLGQGAPLDPALAEQLLGLTVDRLTTT